MTTATYIGILLFDRTPFNSSLTTAKRLKNNNNNNNQKLKKSGWSMKKKKKKEKTATINFRRDGLNCQSSI